VTLAAELAPEYSRAGVAERLLLSGHSHQAWPDVALEGQIEAFEDGPSSRSGPARTSSSCASCLHWTSGAARGW
jgi:hypothetical protein